MMEFIRSVCPFYEVVSQSMTFCYTYFMLMSRPGLPCLTLCELLPNHVGSGSQTLNVIRVWHPKKRVCRVWQGISDIA